MIVVSDTSPINYGALIDEALLPSLFGDIIIPASVFDELSHPGAPEMRPDFVLMDEARGREAAQAMGLCVIGTIGVIERAIRKGLVDGLEVTVKLRATSFGVTPK
jgi:predicted nucleic acid-binding protein